MLLIKNFKRFRNASSDSMPPPATESVRAVCCIFSGAFLLHKHISLTWPQHTWLCTSEPSASALHRSELGSPPHPASAYPQPWRQLLRLCRRIPELALDLGFAPCVHVPPRECVAHTGHPPGPVLTR